MGMNTLQTKISGNGRGAFIPLLAVMLLFLLSATMSAQSICAKAKIEIVQQLTMERQAFDARMKISNPTGFPVEDIRVDILFQDAEGSYVWATADANDDGAFFFVRPEETGQSIRPEVWSAARRICAAPLCAFAVGQGAQALRSAV